MEGDHGRWRDLILCQEDLEGDEQVQVNAHLAACAECRGLLERLRELERSEPPRGMLPPLDVRDRASELSPQFHNEAEQSLLVLRARLGLSEPRTSARRELSGRTLPWRLFGRATPLGRVAVPLALAAGLVLVVLVAREGRDDGMVRDLRVRPYSTDRGGADSVSVGPAVAWRTGDAFVLAFDLEQAAHPIVFHVGPAGEVSLLHPADPSALVPRMSAGRGLELPLPGEQEVWTLEGAPGAETFLIAAADHPDLDIEAVLAGAQTLAREGPPRHELLASIVKLLAAELGPVQTVEIEHLP